MKLPSGRAVEVVKDVVAGLWRDGFIHAGNIAYLSLLTLFPFFILVANVAGALGRTDDGLRAVDAFLRTLPPDVASLLYGPIAGVINAQGGQLLTFGVVVTLWTLSGFIETMREILRRAYQVEATGPIWRYRGTGVLLILGAVLLMLLAFALQVVLTAAQQLVERVFPLADDAAHLIGLGRIAPAFVLFLALWLVFRSLTPGRFRIGRAYPKWPGALLTTAVWLGTTALLPWALSLSGGYSLTYGALSGVMIALLFFFIVGLGFVVGAQLNAALAKPAALALKASEREPGQQGI